MCGKQDVEVVAGWAFFHFRDEKKKGRRDSKVSLEIQSVAIMRWSSEERALVVKA